MNTFLQKEGWIQIYSIEFLNTNENKTDMCDIVHARMCKGHSVPKGQRSLTLGEPTAVLYAMASQRDLG